VWVWIDRLEAYCLHREDKGPVEGWADRAVELDRIDKERQHQECVDELFGETPTNTPAAWMSWLVQVVSA
jgi:hypothetical protein